MREMIAGALLLAGAAFSLLGAVGVLRMPDVYTRLQAATKAGTLGVGFLLAGAAVHFGTMSAWVRCLLVIAFLFLTAPVAAHMISRAAHRSGIPLWGRDPLDELRDAPDRGARGG